MHGALVRERVRIDEMVAADAKDHVEKARARAAIEAAEFHRLADDDVRAIGDWAAREIKRIRREAGRRAKERRADMASYLVRHDAIIDTEIACLESAVADYSATLAHFVESLIVTGDPGEIARRADSVPTPPDLDEVRAQARARAVAAYDWADDRSPDVDDVVAAQLDDVVAAGEAVASAEPDVPATAAPAPEAPVEAPEAPVEAPVAVMDPEANGRAADPPLPVDPLQVPEDEEATETNAQPSGAFRFFRALVPWSAASETPQAKDSEAHRA